MRPNPAGTAGSISGNKKGASGNWLPEITTTITTKEVKMNSKIAPKADALPADPTARDFSRLGAIVADARGRVRPDKPWAPDECAEQLWNSQEHVSFRALAHLALMVAKDPRYKSPAVIFHAAAGRIEL